MSAADAVVGRVVGTEDATPLEFWVALEEGAWLALDEPVALERVLPDGTSVKIYGVVTQVRARHEGARFDSDVFLIERGVLPAEVTQSARIVATRFEPEIFVPPLPGQPVRRARDAERERALFFDSMTRRLPIGLTRDGLPLWANLEFLDGTRGAHVNVSGVSGVATKTSYASFLLHALFTSGALGAEALNTKAIVFNVKGEDLLFLDRPNVRLTAADREAYRRLGLPASPFASVELWAPPRRGDRAAAADVASRSTGVRSFAFTLAEFCADGLLPFLFADVEDERQQYPIVAHNVVARLREARALDDGGVVLEGATVREFGELARLVADRLQDEEQRERWAGRAISSGTIGAFVRRLHAAVPHVEPLIRGDLPRAERHRIRREKQVTVVDIHKLNDRAQRFTVGVMLARVFEEKERAARARPLVLVVLDELNRYAPRDGSSPIKELLLDIAERGRSLGIALFGAEQTASEVERRVVANAALRVVGRLDAAEAAREEYGFLPPLYRQRATISKPGTMILAQPELPLPLVLQFPFPAWATRAEEAGAAHGGDAAAGPDDPFAGLSGPRDGAG